eukprot:1169790-Amphidinium_carterae.1
MLPFLVAGTGAADCHLETHCPPLWAAASHRPLGYCSAPISCPALNPSTLRDYKDGNGPCLSRTVWFTFLPQAQLATKRLQ